MDKLLSTDPNSLAIYLTDDPTFRLAPDRSERQWGWFSPSANTKVSVGDIRQNLQDLRVGPGDTQSLTTELWRLMRDGRLITERLNELMADRGGCSAAIASQNRVGACRCRAAPRLPMPRGARSMADRGG